MPFAQHHEKLLHPRSTLMHNESHVFSRETICPKPLYDKGLSAIDKSVSYLEKRKLKTPC